MAWEAPFPSHTSRFSELSLRCGIWISLRLKQIHWHFYSTEWKKSQWNECQSQIYTPEFLFYHWFQWCCSSEEWFGIHKAVAEIWHSIVPSWVDRFLYRNLNLNNILRIILWQQTWGVGFSEEQWWLNEQQEESYPEEREKLEISLLQQLQHNPELHWDSQHCGFVQIPQVKCWVCFHQV